MDQLIPGADKDITKGVMHTVAPLFFEVLAGGGHRVGDLRQADDGPVPRRTAAVRRYPSRFVL